MSTAPEHPAYVADHTSRIRFVAVGTQNLAAGRSRADVELERHDGTRVVGTRTGEASAVGALRVVAEATVDALHAAAGTEVQFVLVGVKTVRAFDQSVVLVLLTTRGARGVVRLVGAAVGDSADEADVSRATVLAVLNASNRAIGRAPV